MASFDFSNQFYNPYGNIAGAWTNNFNTGWNFSTPTFGATTTSTSASESKKDTRNETYEERKARIEKERAEALLKQQEAEQLSQLNDIKSKQTKELEKQLSEINEAKEQIEKNKKADGSSSIVAKRKDQGFWGKAGRWLSNAGTAVVNMGKSFIGYDKKTGKPNLKKCLTNVGIAVAAVGACFIPVFGPFIGYGLAVAGVGMGTASAVKGYKNLKKAERSGDDAAIDKAQQEIMGGAFVGVTSAIGLKGMGSGFRTAATTASKASAAVERTSMIGKIGQSISNFGRDITVNAWRATKTAASNDMAAVAANGFFKSWGAKISSAYKGYNDPKTRYENQRADMNTRIDNRLNKVESDIQQIEALGTSRGSLTQVEKQRLALLKEERMLLNENKLEMELYFRDTCERSLYEGLSSDNSAIRASETIGSRSTSSNPYLVQGENIPQAQLQEFNSRIIIEQNKYSNALSKLVKAKEEAMRALAKNQDANMIELSQYIPSPNVNRKWYKIGDWRKSDYQLAIGGSNSAHWGELSKIALTSPTTVVPKALGNLQPIYSTPFMFGQDLTVQEVEATWSNLESQRLELKSQLETIERIQTIDEWNAWQKALQRVQNEREEAQRKAQEAATTQEAKQA